MRSGPRQRLEIISSFLIVSGVLSALAFVAFAFGGNEIGYFIGKDSLILGMFFFIFLVVPVQIISGIIGLAMSDTLPAKWPTDLEPGQALALEPYIITSHEVGHYGRYLDKEYKKIRWMVRTPYEK